MRLHKNQIGSAVIVLLVVVVVAVVGFTGYSIWHTKHDTKITTGAVTTQPDIKHSTPAAPDPTTDWTPFTSAAGKFSLRYPTTWVQPTNQQLCGDFLARTLEIGPDASSVIKCATDGSVSQISVTSVDGDKRTDAAYTLTAQNYNAITTDKVTADSVAGTQTKGTAIHQQDGAGLGGYPDGTIVMNDVFYTNNTTYVATYVQTPSDATGLSKDNTGIFDLLIGTLKFK